MKKLCVIFGGASSEHDISIITGLQLCKNIEMKYIVEKIYVGLDNKFYLATNLKELKDFENKEKLNLKQVYFLNGALYKTGMLNSKVCDVECVVNCCHGGIGENGDLSSFFEVINIPYTNASSLSSKIAMDKSLAKFILKNSVPTIKGVKVTKENFNNKIDYIKKNLTNNLIVKPNSLGSSIGVKCCSKENFVDQINAIFEMNDDALVEERVVNIKEYNQACFKTEEGLMLSAIEQVSSKSDFLTFEDKYKGGKIKGSDRVIPAQIPPELEEEIINYTSKVYKKLNLNGVVRIDYIFDETENKLYFNEVNTIPGSMAFYLYEPVGIDYITLVEQLVKNATIPKCYTYFKTDILKDKKI